MGSPDEKDKGNLMLLMVPLINDSEEAHVERDSIVSNKIKVELQVANKHFKALVLVLVMELDLG